MGRQRPQISLIAILTFVITTGAVLSLKLHVSSSNWACGWPFSAYFPANSDLYGQWLDVV
jgi:hypothetical protein